MSAVLIGTITLGSDAASMSISSIDQSYKDIFCVWSIDTDSTTSLAYGTLSFAGSTSFSVRTSYWETYNNSVTETSTGNDSTSILVASTNSNYGGGTARNGNGFAYMADYSVNRDGHYGWYWSSSSATNSVRFMVKEGSITLRGTGTIDEVTITGSSGNLTAGSTMSVYGIPAGSGGATISS